jgi:transposase
MKYIGIDIHKQYFVATVMHDNGKVLGREMVSTDREAIRDYFSRVGSKDELSAVIEACYEWSYFYDEIRDKVKELKVAHPLKTRLIAEARIKTDTIDADALAHLLRADLIPEAYAPEFETRDKKNLLRYRSSLVKTRTMLKNKVHAVLARNYIEEKGFRKLTDKFGKKGKGYIRGFKLRGNDTEILNHYVDLIEYIEGKLNDVERRIRESFKIDETCKLIESIPGIGEILAVMIRYEIDEIDRFSSTSRLCSYAGLVPSTYSTGGKTYQGRITKQGNRWLRWAMTEAAQKAVIKDIWLGRYYERIAKRRGTKRARIAVARKLLEIIYRIWRERRPYCKKSVAVSL